jgi:hypothetical protein
MTDLTVEQQNAIARERELSRIREARNIFLEVFGPPEKRTPHGKFILDTLTAKFGRGLPKNVTDNGTTDIPLTFRKFGHYDVLEAINDIIEWRETDHVHPSSTSP